MGLLDSFEASIQLNDHAFIRSSPPKNQRPKAQTPVQLWNQEFQPPAKDSFWAFYWVPSPVDHLVHTTSRLDFSSPCPCCCALRTTRLHGDNSTYWQEQIEISVHGLGYSEITLYQTPYSEAGWRCVSSCFLSFNKQLLLKVRNSTRLGSQLLSTWDRQLCSECCSPDWTKITAGRTNYF